MKIVHIITRMIVGGAQENTLLTCQGLQERGHDVTLITGPALGPEGQLMDRALVGGYRVIALDCLRRRINPFHDVPGYFKLKKLLSESAPDIVHTHSAKAGVLGRGAAAAVRRSEVKACCRISENVQKARGPAPGSMRIVHTVHGWAFHPYQGLAPNKLYIALERHAAKHTDTFICVAEAMKRQGLAAQIGRQEQYTRIFSGMETEVFLRERSAQEIAALRADLDLPTDAIVIATVARLAELKGHDTIIAAAHELAPRHPNVYWLFVGDGHLRGQVERQIEAAGIKDRVRLTGLVPPERVADLLHASDMLVHCSLREGLARALPQALLCGKPAICYDLDGAGEVVFDGKTGLLLPPEDIASLVKAQEKLIDDQQLRLRLGSAGREFCAQEFPWQLMVQRIEKVYESLL